MATLVQSITPADSVTSNPTSAAFSSAVTIGNRIIACVVTDHSGSTGAVTAVSGGGVTTWSLDNDQGVSTPSRSMEFWSGVVTSNVTTGVSFTWSTGTNTQMWWFIQEWNGLGTFDKASTIASGSSTALLSTGTGTLTQADSTIFGLGEWRTTAATTATAGSGYSGLIQGSNTNGGSIMGGALQSKQVAATTSVTSDMTLSPTNAWGAIAAAYKNSGVSVATPPQIKSYPSQSVQRSYFW